MSQEPYSKVFQDLLDKARSLEGNNPEFVKVLERLFVAVISGPLAGQKVSFASAWVSSSLFIFDDVQWLIMIYALALLNLNLNKGSMDLAAMV